MQTPLSPLAGCGPVGEGTSGKVLNWTVRSLNHAYNNNNTIRAPLRPKMSLTTLSKCTPAHGEGPPGLESPTFQSAVHVAHIPLNHARQLYWTVLSLRYVELNHWRIYNIRNSKCLPYTPPQNTAPPSPFSWST